MKREIYVSIPQPCHERWDAMTPQDQGRFCDSCAKIVIDFSQMSDTQVLDYLSQAKGRLCGRFAQNQIERPLIPVKKDKKKIWWMAALMPLTLLMNKANGQFKTEKRTSNIEYNKCERSIGLVAVGTRQVNDSVQSTSNNVITGIIVDENKHPITGASIILKGTRVGTITDTSGKFHLNFADNNPSGKIIVSYIGYQEKELSYSFSDANEININIQSLLLAPSLTGEVVVVAGYAIPHRRVKKTDTVKTIARKILHTNSFKVYPNPAIRGTAVHIEVKKEGHYSIQLLDANSKLITNSLFDAIKGATKTSIHIPSSITSGMYYICLINDDTKQQYTDKILVQ